MYVANVSSFHVILNAILWCTLENGSSSVKSARSVSNCWAISRCTYIAFTPESGSFHVIAVARGMLVWQTWDATSWSTVLNGRMYVPFATKASLLQRTWGNTCRFTAGRGNLSVTCARGSFCAEGIWRNTSRLCTLTRAGMTVAPMAENSSSWTRKSERNDFRKVDLWVSYHLHHNSTVVQGIVRCFTEKFLWYDTWGSLHCQCEDYFLWGGVLPSLAERYQCFRGPYCLQDYHEDGSSRFFKMLIPFYQTMECHTQKTVNFSSLNSFILYVGLMFKMCSIV